VSSKQWEEKAVQMDETVHEKKGAAEKKRGGNGIYPHKAKNSRLIVAYVLSRTAAQ